jgi:hypothetical protein
MRRWCCVIRHRAICRAYTQGALFYAKVKIARSNISRGRQSLTREQKLERFPLEFFAEQITSEICCCPSARSEGTWDDEFV